MIGAVLSTVVIVSLLAIGVLALFAPRRLSEQYGIVLDDPRALALFRALGVRDAVIGVLLATLALVGRDVLAWGMCLGVSIALADVLLVRADRRSTGRGGDATLLVHAGGIVGLLVTAASLLAGC